MSRFEEIVISFDGADYKVAPNKVMGLIETVESIITIEEINSMLRANTIKRAQVSRAYSSALIYAGAKVNQEDVYDSLFSGEMLKNTVDIMVGLLAMMIPPEHLRSKTNPKPKAQKVAASKSSVKRTKRQ